MMNILKKPYTILLLGIMMGSVILSECGFVHKPKRYTEHELQTYLIGEEEILAYNAGVYAFQSGLYLRAEEKFLESLEINPDFFEANYNLGTLYYIRGKYDKAVEYLTKAKELNPSSEAVQTNLRLARAHHIEEEEAIEEEIETPSETESLIDEEEILGRQPQTELTPSDGGMRDIGAPEPQIEPFNPQEDAGLESELEDMDTEAETEETMENGAEDQAQPDGQENEIEEQIEPITEDQIQEELQQAEQEAQP